MEPLKNKFVNNIVECDGYLKKAEYILNVTIPVVKDQKLLVRALESIHKCASLLVSSILKYEYLFKRVELTESSEKNLETFFKRCSSRYGLNEQDNKLIEEIFLIQRKYKSSGFDFSKKGKVVFMDDNLELTELSMNKVRDFINVLSKLLKGARESFKAAS